MGYAEDVDYASANLIKLMSHEEGELAHLWNQLDTEQRAVAHFQWDFETSDLNEDFSDAYVHAAFARMAKADQHAQDLRVRVSALEASIGARRLAVQAISGALLQVVKQGIAVVHGSLADAPAGRKVGSVNLKDVVWQGRNQSLHFEENEFRQPLKDVFRALAENYGDAFCLEKHAGQNLAKSVVWLLGWNSYDQYRADIRDLGL
ncbi:MAG: hypothetical protein JNL14_06555 [Devosia sp.]|uniref:hypothetical protein n=1 Tax=Devosia sp. TaxID=1871048 RepID=UPI001A56291B|nr:hypothetical protein [Devosia sp.]MBL8597382.1 hypothetical protein [Devosia sp.]